MSFISLSRAARAVHVRFNSIHPATGGALCALLLTGCGAQLRAASAGQIGCSPDEVVISDNHAGWGSRTWTATCRGEDYSCSAVATGNNTSQVNCAKMAATDGSAGGATSAPTTAAPAVTSEVGRELDPATKETRVRGKFQLGGGVQAVLVAAPRSAPGKLAALVEGTSDGPLDQCRQLSALVNAQPFAGEGVESENRSVGSFGLHASFPVEGMQGLEKPYAEFALQACEHTWKFSAPQVEDLKKLLIIARDLAQEASAPAAAPTPAPGT